MWYTLDCLAAARTGFIHSDHLGSTSLTTDITGTLVAETRYLPYGEERWITGTLVTDFTFTGQRADSYIKLVEMGARWYDPQIGRWISPDTIIPDPGNPQSLNRLTYVHNNPIRYTNPSGHCIFGLDTAVCIAVGVAILKAVDYGWTAYDTWQSTRVLNDLNASSVDRRLAELNIALALTTELAEPDDELPVGQHASGECRKAGYWGGSRASKPDSNP